MLWNLECAVLSAEPADFIEENFPVKGALPLSSVKSRIPWRRSFPSPFRGRLFVVRPSGRAEGTAEGAGADGPGGDCQTLGATLNRQN